MQSEIANLEKEEFMRNTVLKIAQVIDKSRIFSQTGQKRKNPKLAGVIIHMVDCSKENDLNIK